MSHPVSGDDYRGIVLVDLARTAVDSRVTESFTEPLQQSQVAASESGVVSRIWVVEGQSVREGDTIAELNHDALDQTLRIAELRAMTDAKVKLAESRLKIRKSRRDAIQPMLDRGHANPTEVEEAVVEYESSLADLEQARQELAEAKLDVERIKAQIRSRKVTAPFDGVVTELHYRLGESISSSKPQVVTLVQLDQLLVRFYLSEHDVNSLTVGQDVNLQLRDGNQWVQPTARIQFISPVTDPDSGTARIDVVIDNPERRYRSGSPCKWLDSTAESTP
ncbi:efflux RND transporter periplasmic adaptor subunit [Stieleria varia]|nr:efflux RND transporter periplasmic adaptor subunit [Stieleria varia]